MPAIRAIRSEVGTERGSAFLVSLMLLSVMTILGLALFNLGVIESRMVAVNHADAQAFEIAQAGVERAIERLLRTMVGEEGAAAGPSWANGDGPGNASICTGGCSAIEFRAAESSYISDTAFGSGSYALSFKLLTVSEANGNPYGQTCIPDTASLCTNLIFVRSTGTVTGAPAGYSTSRTIQLLARATSTSVFAGGIATAGSAGGAIRGNVKIAGSINIFGAEGAPSINFGGGAGIRNNWADLAAPPSPDPASLARLAPLQLVCPPGRICPTDTNKVYSLGATLMVAKPTAIPAIVLGGGASLGQSQATADGQPCYHSPCRHGKGPLDAILVADGCVMPCTDNFTGVTVNSNVFVDGDNITRPYPSTVLPFPALSDPTTIPGGNPSTYAHYACVHGSSCNPGTSTPAGEFFLNHAADLTAVPCVPAGSCPGGTVGGLFSSANGLHDNIAAFSSLLFSFPDKTGTLQTGQICWKRTTGANLPPPFTLEFGIGPTGCEKPTTPQLIGGDPLSGIPLLLYMNSNFAIDRQAGPTDYNYRGAAIFLVTGVAKIEERLQSCQTTGVGTACANADGSGQMFPKDHMLTVITTNRMEVGKTKPNIDRVMGFFGCLPRDPNLPCDFYSQKQTNIVGNINAVGFCFGGGCGDTGGQVPSFFQVPTDRPPAELFGGSGNRWAVSSVRGFWIECVPGATPTSLCGYE